MSNKSMHDPLREKWRISVLPAHIHAIVIENGKKHKEIFYDNYEQKYSENQSKTQDDLSKLYGMRNLDF